MSYLISHHGLLVFREVWPARSRMDAFTHFRLIGGEILVTVRPSFCLVLLVRLIELRQKRRNEKVIYFFFPLQLIFKFRNLYFRRIANFN